MATIRSENNWPISDAASGKESTEPTGFSIAALQQKEPGAAEGEPEAVWVLGFRVADKPFAVGVENTEGVVDCPRLSPLPSAPEMVIGVGSVRGRITLVVDLSMATSECARRRLILLRGEAQLGLLADHIEGVIPLKPKDLREFTESRLRRRGRAEASLRQAAGKIARTYFKRDGRAVPVVDLEMVSNL